MPGPRLGLLLLVLALGGPATALDEGDLLATILSNYNKNRRPVRNTSEPVRVTMDMTIQQLIGLVSDRHLRRCQRLFHACNSCRTRWRRRSRRAPG